MQPSRSTPLVTPPTAKVAQRQKGKQRKAKRLDIPRWMATRKTALINAQRRCSWHRSGAQRTETPSVRHGVGSAINLTKSLAVTVAFLQTEMEYMRKFSLKNA
ncbi:hypothetical protein NC651_028207 [Populus alba x Populus x berolinensis]|nr:hypothetical protein NC651_028207 [Populus alba x Populus x berolinensis]